MNIFFYISTLEKGGAERVVTQLAKEFGKQDNNITIITSFKGKNEYEVPSYVRRINLLKEKDTSNKIKRNLNLISKLRKIIKRDKPDLLISFMQEPNVRSIIATRGLRTKSIISVRNDPKMEYPGTIGHIISKYLLPKANGCVFQTEDAKNFFPKTLQDKSTIIFNQVDEKFFDVDKKEGEYIVSIGRLSPQKNHKMLINAFEKVNQKCPNERLLIYGKGELKEELEYEINKRGLKHNIHLMGLTSDVPKVLSKAKMFILSSDYEGMPNTLLEAMAVGLPCISTDCPCAGPRTIIDHGKDGLLVPIEDEKELARSILLLLEDKNFYNRVCRNAKEKSKIFKPSYIFKQWEDYFVEVINR